MLGSGPELFVRIRQTRDTEEEGLEEIHAAMKDISATRKKARADPLGGDSWTRAAGRARVTARQFRRAPGPAWRKKRKPVD